MIRSKPFDLVICTTPIRPTPTDYPPLGSLAVIQSLRGAGYDPYFFDIDGTRPSFEQVEEFFRRRQPDVVGISAVVSTAYAYVKKLSRMIRKVSPKTRLVLGGNLAASAEILHRLAGIDFCVAGEGEIVAVNIMNYLRDRAEKGLAGDNYEALGLIKGISFLDPAGHMVFTGFETAIPGKDLFEPDFSILEKYSRIENFVIDPLLSPGFYGDARSYQPHRKGQKAACVVGSKGCVARCTFCHRWDKGYRSFEVEKIVRMITYLRDRYNVGFFYFGDENFGSDRRQVTELLEALKPLDVLFIVQGMRCRTTDLDLLQRLKAAGCCAVYYGMESGSQRILDVMEKNLSIQHNINAARWTAEAGLSTVYQLVVAMPGENNETIGETAEFFKRATEVLPEMPVNRLSINYIQALPGTPVYEYARLKGFLGKSLQDEEKYLELISDVEAGDDTKFINLTDWDNLTVQSWRRRIILECVANYQAKNKIPGPTLRDIYRHTILKATNPAAYERLRQDDEKRTGRGYKRGGYFNLQRELYYEIIAAYLYPLRTPMLWAWLLCREYQRLSFNVFAARVWETVRRRLIGPGHDAYADYRSLRKVVNDATPALTTQNEQSMAPFRAGR